MSNLKPAAFGAVFAISLWGVGCGGPELGSDDLAEEAADLQDDDDDKADAATAKAPKTITVTEAKNGKTVTARVGDTVDVRLAGNPTTGYQWYVVSQSKSLPVVAQSYLPSQSVKIGSGGVYSFILKPDLLAAGGKHTTKLAYYRSWEGAGKAIQKFSVTISVKAVKSVQCGPNVCAAGEVCCNASCGICTPPGGFCSQQVCAPACGPTTCLLACPNGLEKDANGCEICKCKITCQQTGCPSGRQCIPCKTTSGWDFFCIPNGAMC